MDRSILASSRCCYIYNEFESSGRADDGEDYIEVREQSMRMRE